MKVYLEVEIKNFNF